MSRYLVAVLSLFAVFFTPAFAQSNPDALSLFKTYFVTGDYAVAGVGLRGQGDAFLSSKWPPL